MLKKKRLMLAWARACQRPGPSSSTSTFIVAISSPPTVSWNSPEIVAVKCSFGSVRISVSRLTCPFAPIGPSFASTYIAAPNCSELAVTAK